MYMEELDQLAPAGRSCMPIVVTAEWLGHAGPTFTMRTYVHSQDDALKRAAETTSCDTVVTLSGSSNAVSRVPEAGMRSEVLVEPAKSS
jgi:hypothetical protein